MWMQRPVAFVPVLADILTERVEQHALQEDARLRGLHLRHENARRRVSGLRGPSLGVRECENTCPGRQGRDDLEGFRERT